ncbi:MAG: NAD(P)/FAD-dependent oxidoreductase [Lachnospiraceae bacterium]|nr:NAD(P)/FAD-dependent oxidoreductase [Lachnospiraceae bacterium]
MIYDLIVVGGGAAGMIAAITAAKSGKKVIIIERMNRLGKKILATGNGRCNFTNSFLDDTCYRSSQNRFPYLALEQFDHTDAIAFFEQLGIAVTERKGYYYPRSNQAATVADALIYKIKSLQIDVILECKIDNIRKKSGKFMVLSDRRKFQGYHLLLAAGGKAQEKLGSDGSGFHLAEQLGHTIIKPFPALTALEVKRHFLKAASGVRCQCKIAALLNETVISEEQGELQITKYGVSGVMIFQLSRYMIEGIRHGKKAELYVDFLPEIKNQDLFMNQMKEYSNHKNARQWMEGYFPSKLAVMLLQEAGIPFEKNVSNLSKTEKSKIWHMIKKCPLNICGWKDFEFAQATAGGVNVKEVSPYTMESDLVPGLYFAGEILDVDGTCGGYNLQWAWTSGYLAGRSIS